MDTGDEMMSRSLRKCFLVLTLSSCVLVGMFIAILAVISCRKSIDWSHLPTQRANWLFEFHMVDGAFYVGWSHFGIGYVPWYLPFSCVMVWPVVATFVYLRRRRQSTRGFEVSAFREE